MQRLFLSAILLFSLSATAQAWQVDSVQFQLQEELVIRGSDEWFFGGIADIEVDAEGNIYVNDDRQFHIKVFSPEGEWIGTLGREGNGPGEFRDVTDIAVREDELAVLDRKAFLVSFFNTSAMDYTNGFTFKPVQTEAGGGNAREIMYLSDNKIALVNSVPPSTSNAGKEDNINWLVLNGEGRITRLVEDPAGEVVYAVGNDRLYTGDYTDNGGYVVRRYRLVPVQE